MFESKSEIEFLADVPLEYQVYEFVKEAGIDGVSTRVSCVCDMCRSSAEELTSSDV
jgi:hypothetical protein